MEVMLRLWTPNMTLKKLLTNFIGDILQFLHLFDIAKKCEVKKLYMFHYDPESSDEHIIGLHKRAQQYIEKVKKKTNFEVFTSHEGLCVEI